MSIETPVFYEHLSAKENLSIYLAYMDAEGDIPQTLAMVGLGEVDNRPVSKFSFGLVQAFMPLLALSFCLSLDLALQNQ